VYTVDGRRIGVRHSSSISVVYSRRQNSGEMDVGGRESALKVQNDFDLRSTVWRCDFRTAVTDTNCEERGEMVISERMRFCVANIETFHVGSIFSFVRVVKQGRDRLCSHLHTLLEQ
jgi:hypothetical protein